VLFLDYLFDGVELRALADMEISGYSFVFFLFSALGEPF
jgi:hypothetical protein